MGSLSGERVEDDRKRRDQRFSLAGLHLRDLALVERHAAHQLDVEMAQADRAAGDLANEREHLREQIVERFSGFQPAAVLRSLRQKGLVVHGLHFGFQFVDPGDDVPISRERAFIGVEPQRALDPFKHKIHLVKRVWRIVPCTVFYYPIDTPFVTGNTAD